MNFYKPKKVNLFLISVVLVFFFLSPFFMPGASVSGCTGDWDCEYDAHCDVDDIKVTEYSCVDGTCQPGNTETIAEGGDYDYKFCDGDEVWERQHTCEVDAEGDPCIVVGGEALIESCAGICEEDNDNAYCVNSPNVTTNSATNISINQTTLEGYLDYLGDNSSYADVHFEWRETGSTTWNTTAIQTMTTTGSFDETITELDPGTDYEFRAVATNDGGTTYGSTLTFTTDTANPTVDTLSA